MTQFHPANAKVTTFSIGTSVRASCAISDARELWAETLLSGDRKFYALQAWCVMPNHVHALIATDEKAELGKIVHAWKNISRRRLNEALARMGSVWAKDYFDRFIRDGRHFDTTKQYIEMNPVAAGLCVRPDAWPFSFPGWN